MVVGSCLVQPDFKSLYEWQQHMPATDTVACLGLLAICHVIYPFFYFSSSLSDI